jgi:hypothetical protein
VGLTQQIDYITVEVTLPRPVKKQVWDGKKFVSMTLHKHKGVPDGEKMRWLEKTYGQPGVYKNGSYWDYTKAGNFTVMDEQVYTWYQIKWNNK